MTKSRFGREYVSHQWALYRLGEWVADLQNEKPMGPSVLIDDFGKLVAGFGRFLSSLATIPAFQNSGLSLTEWVALAVLLQSDGINNKQLAARLGVTRQRAHQLIADLSEANLVVVEVSAIDSRENVVRLAPWGRKQLDAVNRELELLIFSALGSRAQVLSRVQKQSALLMKIIKVAKSSDGQGPVPARPGRTDSSARDSQYRLINKASRSTFKQGG